MIQMFTIFADELFDHQQTLQAQIMIQTNNDCTAGSRIRTYPYQNLGQHGDTILGYVADIYTTITRAYDHSHYALHEVFVLRVILFGHNLK